VSSSLDSSPPRIAEIDGLRGVAVLLVIQFHWIVCLPYFNEVRVAVPFLSKLMLTGWCGVDIFFVISGFLIGGILIDRRESPNQYRVFFGRRALRIVPIYYLLLVILALVPPALSSSTVREVPLWGFFAFVQNFFTSLGWRAPGPFGPLWSIAIEEQFYLLAPLILWFAPRRFAFYLLAAAVVFAPILRYILESDWLPLRISAWDFTPARLDGLALGVLGAGLIRSERLRAILGSARRAHRRTLIGLGIVIVALCQFSMMNIGGPIQAVAISLLNVSFLATLLYVVLHGPDSRTAWLLRLPALLSVGRVSYFLYLFHIPALLFVLHSGLRSAVVVLPLAALVVGSLAWISWHWFEGPLIALGRRLRYEAA
jgi:peptidoglycan/LPS O-acetylase OafA/YrhL